MKLTQQEKVVVIHYLNSDPTIWGAMKEYWPFYLPILFVETYGVLFSDMLASWMGFLFLLGFIVWFFKQGGVSGVHLKSALEKYEAEVSAVDDTSNT